MGKFEISRAQFIQAIGARAEIVPEMNPILLKPRGNYYSMVYLNGKRFKNACKRLIFKICKNKGIQTAYHQ